MAASYDIIAEAYHAWSRRSTSDERARYTEELLTRLPEGACVLELGCGIGLPTTKLLAQKFRVTAVDISSKSVAAAQRNVPEARFICEDMTRLAVAPGAFDAIAAFYAIIHVPRDEHRQLLRSMFRWLRPGGLLVLTMGAVSVEAEVAEDWLGVPMYWSHFDSVQNRKLVEEAGFDLFHCAEEVTDEDGEAATFLWVVARKPWSKVGQRQEGV